MGLSGTRLWNYTLGCHLSHITEFMAAVLTWLIFFRPGWEAACKQWAAGWVLAVLGYNVAVGWTVCSFWHWLTYVSPYSKGKLRELKYNPKNQYEPVDPMSTRMFRSSSGHLEREIAYTTLGWLQSGATQCLFMHLWASGALSFYGSLATYPVCSVGWMLFVTYWREFHFYWAHRGIHPWWDRNNGLMQGDVGAFLYRHAHSLHHKSYNPGPWSGLSMHPIEHFVYYSCAWLMPLVITCHPLHFLYCKFHADIAPVGGHDGYSDPAGGGDFHWLHHAKFECNYGVPLIDFDRLFGTWVDYADYKQTGSIRGAKNLRISDAETEAEANNPHSKAQ